MKKGRSTLDCSRSVGWTRNHHCKPPTIRLSRIQQMRRTHGDAQICPCCVASLVVPVSQNQNAVEHPDGPVSTAAEDIAPWLEAKEAATRGKMAPFSAFAGRQWARFGCSNQIHRSQRSVVMNGLPEASLADF